MQFIPLNNKRLNQLLDRVIERVYKPEYVRVITNARPHQDTLQPDIYACSDEYLHKAFKLPVTEYGFPRSAHGMGMKEVAPEIHQFFEPIQKLVEKIGLYIGTPTNALVMAYPDNGFIGWHHNGNAPGFNILMTYSQDGDGCFKYWDREKNEIITMPDQPGWTVKVGYYPSDRKKEERDKVYWHCAETKKQRISLAWVIDHRPMWENMINSITDGSFDTKVLAQQQMTH